MGANQNEYICLLPNFQTTNLAKTFESMQQERTAL